MCLKFDRTGAGIRDSFNKSVGHPQASIVGLSDFANDQATRSCRVRAICMGVERFFQVHELDVICKSFFHAPKVEGSANQNHQRC